MFAMRPGAPMMPLAERLPWLAARPLGWTLGWAVWILAAVALVTLFAMLLRPLPRSHGPLALALVAIGAAVDLTCDVLQMIVVPLVAAADQPALFLALDRALWGGGVILGSGLYCAGMAVATHGLARRGRASRALVASCIACCGCCVVWVVAEVAHARAVLEPITGLTIGAFIVWALILARIEARSSVRSVGTASTWNGCAT
jgi:hypothetical protein